MVNKKNWLGILAMALILGMTVVGCVSSYHIQAFSNEVQTLPVTEVIETEYNRQGSGQTTRTVVEGMFKADNFESACKKAEEAGFTEILSIESGTYWVLGIGIKWVIIRCVKDAEANNLATSQNSETSTGSQPRQQSNETSAVPKLGEPTKLQQALNLVPAVPMGGKNLKFEFGGDTWIAKVNGANFLSGNCIFEETGNGTILTLKATNAWSGAVGEVIDFLQNVGVPLGPAAGPLRTAARLTARVAKWIPIKESAIVLEYKEGPPASLLLGSR
jgi:hypothetical protein